MEKGTGSPLWRLTTKKAGAIVHLGGTGDAYPFYCVHSISGDATTLLPLAQRLGSERKIYGIQIPKDKMNGEFASSVHSIAQHYVDAISDFQPDGPLILGGWSAGSFIALEMAQLLKQRGREIPLLIALDGSLYKDGPNVSAWHPRYYWQVAQNLPPWIADKMSEGWPVRRTAHRIAQNVRRAIVSACSRNPDANRGHSVDAFLDTAEWPPEQAAFVRVLFETVERYEPQIYNGRVIVYVAKTQPLFRPGQVESTWRKFAPSAEFISVNGTHANMIREPRVTALATNLRVRLNKLVTIQGQAMNSPPQVKPFKGAPKFLFSVLGIG